MITLFQTSPKSDGNSGSAGAAISYFSKEDKEDKNRNPNDIVFGFFNSEQTGIAPEVAKELIEHKLYSKSLAKVDSKFFHVLIAFSQDELKGKSDKELIEFAQKNFATMYLEAGKRHEIDPLQLAWCAKLEKTRKYKGDDIEVLQKAKNSGQLKDGDQRHIHIVVARKTLDNRKISPLSNHFKEGQKKGSVTKGFDQDDFRLRLQFEFDDHFSHSRKKEERYEDKLAVRRPDLNLNNNMTSAVINITIDRKLKQLNELISAKAKKVRTFIDRTSAEFKRNFIQLIRKYAHEKPLPLKPKSTDTQTLDTSKNEEIHTSTNRVPSTKPFDFTGKPPFENPQNIHTSTNRVPTTKPFDFIEEMKIIDARKEAQKHLSPAESLEYELETMKLEKAIYLKSKEIQKQKDQDKKTGQDPERKKDNGISR